MVCEEACGALGESPSFYLIVVMSGDEDDRQIGTHAANMALQGDAVHPRHADICDQAAAAARWPPRRKSSARENTRAVSPADAMRLSRDSRTLGSSSTTATIDFDKSA